MHPLYPDFTAFRLEVLQHLASRGDVEGPELRQHMIKAMNTEYGLATFYNRMSMMETQGDVEREIKKKTLENGKTVEINYYRMGKDKGRNVLNELEKRQKEMGGGAEGFSPGFG